MQWSDFLPQGNWQEWFVYDPEKPLLFNSGLFLGLFLVFYALYLSLKNSFRTRILYTVCFSLFFYYKCSGLFFLLLMFTTSLDYTLSYFLYRETHPLKRKMYVWISVLVNLSLLGYFKYTNFIIGSYNDLFNGDFTFYDVILPVGISFYTFQSISYTVEIYRKEITPAKSFPDYIFFVSFFPQLVAGPIVRAKDFIPKIYEKLTITRQEVNYALFLIIGGLIKKAVISDYISINFVDRVFDAPNSYTAFENLMAVYGYTIQIYCDFSGYSDMAIGIALLLGFELPPNFRTPYKSASITEFWRRWHISLSTWLKDFLYISVGGNRRGTFTGFLFPTLFFIAVMVWGISNLEVSYWPIIISTSALALFILSFILASNKRKTMVTNVNLLTTMLLGGLWHGASLRFIVWGALHGIGLAVHKIFADLFPTNKDDDRGAIKLFWKFISIVVTFHFVAFCWIFFRARDFSLALDIINNINEVTFDFEKWTTIIKGYKNVFLLMLVGYIWHFSPQSIITKLQENFNKMPLVVKGIVLGFVFWVVFAAASAGPQPFIYFQF
ncbi:MAG: membrane-bound O-acyltransferase family protein [Flavobacterium sp. MedPE-SWcel]|uniref:MBOAT family O-acyltransferase n=1 Tax=uncultured Flavobacterium sp. TaxID=165435 RepID=UPI00091D535F|nr:MBOAT family O-acyltransferase [uncultured Flavobacterium sp.]OIQ15781.1 MAG: membrane-bound O-acyltransferase family protein [Flavobacterium sp. MedPE-SWcel]